MMCLTAFSVTNNNAQCINYQKLNAKLAFVQASHKKIKGCDFYDPNMILILRGYISKRQNK